MTEDAINLILRRLDRIDERLDQLDVRYLPRELHLEQSKGQGERIGALELDVQSLADERKWLFRLCLSAVVMTAASLFITGCDTTAPAPTETISFSVEYP